MGPLVHLVLTREWAREAGFDAEVAERIAAADIAVDVQHPGGSLPGMPRHFGVLARYWARREFAEAVATRSPEALGRALHSAQDAIAHGAFGLAHIRWDLKIGRNPDDWHGAPERVRQRIRDRSMQLLREYRARL